MATGLSPVNSMEEDKCVLAIQSHVVHGYVGNRAATFPLQLRGWDVDAMNAVQFSNHTGYGTFTGYRLDGKQIHELYQGLSSQRFHYDALLTGYLPSADVVAMVGQIAIDLKTRISNCVWLLDPVMGDDGSLYVKDDVVPAYKAILKVKDLVTITTPNYFEVELLTGIKLESKADVLRALNVLHTEYGIPNVVISSLPHPNDPAKLLTVGSSAQPEGDGHDRKYKQLTAPFVIEQVKLDTYFTGTGDLFAALLLDNYTRLGPEKLAEATTSTIATLRRVLLKTWAYSKKHYVGSVRMRDPSMRYHELRLVQSKDLLLDNDIGEVKWEPYS